MNIGIDLLLVSGRSEANELAGMPVAIEGKNLNQPVVKWILQR